jgi:hypothetical protein
MKVSISWDITQRIPLKVNTPIGGTRRLHFHDRRINEARKQRDAGNNIGWDGEVGDMFIGNVG